MTEVNYLQFMNVILRKNLTELLFATFEYSLLNNKLDKSGVGFVVIRLGYSYEYI